MGLLACSKQFGRAQELVGSLGGGDSFESAPEGAKGVIDLRTEDTAAQIEPPFDVAVVEDSRHAFLERGLVRTGVLPGPDAALVLAVAELLQGLSYRLNGQGRGEVPSQLELLL